MFLGTINIVIDRNSFLTEVNIMDVFLIGAAVGAIGGSVLSFVKNPYTGNQFRGDIKTMTNNFGAAVGRAKNIYHELEEKRMYPDEPEQEKAEVKTDAESGASEEEKKPEVNADVETSASEKEHHEPKQMKPTPKIERIPQHVTMGEKAHDFVDAVTHASFKAIDHKKLFAMILGKNKQKNKKDNK